MTFYKCNGCGETFTGHDPIVTEGHAALCLPTCPKAALAIKDIQEKAQHTPLEAYKSTDADMKAIIGKHPVTYAEKPDQPPAPIIPVPPKLPGAWSKPLALKPETEEEKKQREEQARLDAMRRETEQAAQEIEADARALVNKMLTSMKQGSSNVSSNFGKDRQYGISDSGKQTTASLAVITRAGILWKAQGDDFSYRPPTYKQIWQVKMANFERLIVSGKEDEGKHNYHVVPTK